MKPVQYTPPHQIIVDEFNDLADDEKTSAYWGLDKVSPVRKQIKDHYIAEQQQRCCYCKMDLQTKNNGVWDGEHILSRNAYVKFMFEPRNLSASCKDCNIAKGEKEVLNNPGRKTFPTLPDDYKIVHPHFDDYAEHIIWIDDLCKPRSQKGIDTIHICNLLRHSLSPIGAEDRIEDDFYYKTVGTLLKSSASIVEKQMANAALDFYLKDKKNNKGSAV